MYILVIDDNLDDRLLIVRELEREFPGLQVEAIGDAVRFEQALAVGGFDLVITDYQLRWSNGLELFRAIKNRYQDCPVIMFTNTGTQEIAVQAMKEGLDDYILKSPKHFPRLAASARLALERVEERRKTTRLEVRLQYLLNQLNVGVFRATPEEGFIEGNRAFLQLLELSSIAQANTRKFDELFSNWETLLPKQRRERELYLRLIDGSDRWLLVSETLTTASGNILIDGLIEDITNRKRTEATLKRYARRMEILQELDRSILRARSLDEIASVALSSIAELLPYPLFFVTVFDMECSQGTVLAVRSLTDLNFSRGQSFALQDYEEFKDLQQEELVIENLIEPSSVYPFKQPLLAGGIRSLIKMPLKAEGHLIGSLNIGASQPSALTSEEIEIAHEVANQLTIAIQQSRLREELHLYAEHLEQLVSNRTQQLEEAISDLEAYAYSVSHDLQEPLRAMQGFANLLLEDYGDRLNSVGQRFVNRIIRASERMETLLQDLLFYNRLNRLNLELQPVNLRMAVEEALPQLERQLYEQRAQVIVEQPLLEVMGHYMTIVQIITNLIANAIKFVVPGVQPRVRIWTEKRDRFVRLWIEDNGIGIEPRYQERIFSVFERLHGEETYPGTGIGLAIVRKGVERMGGQVGVESKEGRGSRFWIELLGVED